MILPVEGRVIFVLKLMLVGEVLNTIKLLANKGTTMVLITHEINFAKEVSDRVIFMYEGSIKAEGTVEEILENPSDESLVKFLK
jgi:ABC superfamily ATP binding cassette transporter, ABC protein